jgi:hypothetical protein
MADNSETDLTADPTPQVSEQTLRCREPWELEGAIRIGTLTCERFDAEMARREARRGCGIPVRWCELTHSMVLADEDA